MVSMENVNLPVRQNTTAALSSSSSSSLSLSSSSSSMTLTMTMTMTTMTTTTTIMMVIVFEMLSLQGIRFGVHASKRTGNCAFRNVLGRMLIFRVKFTATSMWLLAFPDPAQ